MMLEINEGHLKNKLKQTTDTTTTPIHCSEYTQEEDLVEERRKIFGEEEYPTQMADKDKEDQESDNSVERNLEEEEEEFLIVMTAAKERKKHEADLMKGSLLKDKLSQTGWKIRRNFNNRNHANMDEKDRIDLFSTDKHANDSLS